ncbi:MAG: hypothetical protein ACPLPR_00200 [Bacillota bacterium]
MNVSQVQSTQVPGVKTPSSDQELRKACSEFEALFLVELLKQARFKLLSDSGVDTPSRPLLEQFALEALGQALSQAGGVGIAQKLYEALSGKKPPSAGTGISGA